MATIYIVTTPTGRRIVRAKSKYQAINFCVKNDYTAESMSANDVAEALTSGATLEDATKGGDNEQE